MNHWEHCDVQIEEEELHEFERPFGPMPCEGLEAIRLHEVREPFVAGAGGETELFDRERFPRPPVGCVYVSD